MLALGVLLTCGALLALAMSALIFRGLNPPRWTTTSWASELLAVVVVSMLGLGVADTIAAAARAYRDGPSLVDLGLVAAVVVVSWLIWRRLDLRTRLRAMPVSSDADRAVRPRAGRPAPAGPAVPPPTRPSPRAA